MGLKNTLAFPTHRICCGLLTGESSKAWGLVNLDVVAVSLISLGALAGVGFSQNPISQFQSSPKGLPPSLPLPPRLLESWHCKAQELGQMRKLKLERWDPTCQQSRTGLNQGLHPAFPLSVGVSLSVRALKGAGLQLPPPFLLIEFPSVTPHVALRS